MFFHVYVKRATRKGGEVVVDRVVEFDGNQLELYGIMSNNYQGLIVECVEIQKIVNVEKKANQPVPVKQNKDEHNQVITSKLKIKVIFNDDENALHKTALLSLKEFNNAVNLLNKCVRERYGLELKNFGYVSDVDTFRKHDDYTKPFVTLVLDYGMTEFVEKISQQVNMVSDLSVENKI